MQLLDKSLKNQENEPQNFPLTTGDPPIKNQEHRYYFGQWNEKEILKYFLFIFHHKQKFQSKSMRKSLKVFKQMAKFIKSRNSSQCRTHHQNLMNKCKNLENALRMYIQENPTFFDKYEAMKESLKILDNMEFCEDTSTVVREAKRVGSSDAESSSTEMAGKAGGKSSRSLILIPQPTRRQINEEQSRQQKLMECQYLFTLWAKKVNRLTQFPLQ